MNADSSRLTRSVLRWTPLALALVLGGCSSVSEFMSGEKVDYKSGARQTTGLEVPPDLTQLAREGRYQPPAPVVSASSSGAPAATSNAPTAAASPTVAVDRMDGMRIERDGQARWLHVPQSPEQIWPQVKAFWLESGFTLAVDNAQVGVMETDWAENRAKLPQDLVRGTLGRLIDGLYDTGERDRFRTRIERGTEGGSDIYVTHRGLVEEFTEQQLKDQLRWLPRDPDPQLEAEFLSRLMLRLGSTDKVARTEAVQAAATVEPARARMLADQPTATVALDEGFDRAWRRVGLALDRTGFTVEDRNRADGLYFVRYVDIKSPTDQGFFSRLFGNDDAAKAQRYRVRVQGSAEQSRVTILTDQGDPVPGDVGQRIAKVLLSELR